MEWKKNQGGIYIAAKIVLKLHSVFLNTLKFTKVWLYKGKPEGCSWDRFFYIGESSVCDID